MIEPRHFISEFMEPALALWGKHQNVKHLAIHALIQIDVLSGIVALHVVSRGSLERSISGERRGFIDDEPAPGADPSRLNGAVDAFRDDLCRREPVLGIVRSVCETFSKGLLSHGTAPHASDLCYPELLTRHGFFLDKNGSRGPMTPFEALILVFDGRELELQALLCDAVEAWGRELSRLKF